ncbi:hypothetical protein B0H17DRAFT_45931 [Mycena rosella]|uniref:Uncharacterized protein n=1 Tax=Mycena rosella TaxID=1033263 RepID=A0AAD7D738_MYCRO|nr:hypothetical protein B0H17DRAFT_45931 [Mycena rosella]
MAVVLPLLFLFLSLLPPTLASFIVDPVTAKAATCEPVLLQWQGGKVPWTLHRRARRVHLREPGTFKNTSFHWTVDLAAGTVVAARLTDATGATATSNSFTIQDGTTGCNQFVAVPPPPGTTASVPADTQSATTTTTSRRHQPRGASRVLLVQVRPPKARRNPPPPVRQPQPVPAVPAVPCTTNSEFPQIQPTNNKCGRQGPYPESSPSAAPAYQTTRRKTNVGTVFAILIPCLILLVILGLCFMRWRRRRRSPEPPQPLGPFALGLHIYRVARKICLTSRALSEAHRSRPGGSPRKNTGAPLAGAAPNSTLRKQSRFKDRRPRRHRRPRRSGSTGLNTGARLAGAARRSANPTGRKRSAPR